MMTIETKFNGVIDFELYREYLIKSIYKILPLREEGKEWEKYLDRLQVELNGLDALTTKVELVSLVSMLEGLRQVETHELFRKIIFDCIDIVKKIDSDNE